MPSRPWLAFVALAATQVGCQDVPDRLCDRVGIIWPFVDVDVSDDTAPEVDGIQLDVTLRSNLAAGSEVVLSVAAEGEVAVPHPVAAVVADDGEVHFDDVTVPLGRVELALVAYGECGQFASAREVYVWDGAGFPDCALSLGVEPVPSEAHAPLDVIGADADVDDDADGIQIPVRVDTGRPDLSIALFVRDIESQTDEILRAEPGQLPAVDFVVTVPEGEVALRAVCSWAVEDLHPSSHTERFFVEP
jgi:hypothetical protein